MELLKCPVRHKFRIAIQSKGGHIDSSIHQSCYYGKAHCADTPLRRTRFQPLHRSSVVSHSSYRPSPFGIHRRSRAHLACRRHADHRSVVWHRDRSPFHRLYLQLQGSNYGWGGVGCITRTLASLANAFVASSCKHANGVISAPGFFAFLPLTTSFKLQSLSAVLFCHKPTHLLDNRRIHRLFCFLLERLPPCVLRDAG